MSNTPIQTSRSALISGASIAGPTLAYWLRRYGFDVTVVERAAAVRRGGYPIDIRGTAMGVVERMGLRPQVEAAHIATRDLTFVDAMGKVIGSIPIYDVTVNEAGQDVELPRGELTTMLYGLTRDSAVRYRFKDSIEALEDDGVGVDVRFASGARQRYDVVIGADGIHSNTRRLAFDRRSRSVIVSAQRSTSSPCRTIWAFPMAPSSMQRRGAPLACLPCATARTCLFSWSSARRGRRLAHIPTKRSRFGGQPLCSPPTAGKSHACWTRCGARMIFISTP